MKPLTTMMFASVIVAALAGAEGRQMTLVKGSPTTDSFDISWVDNATQKYYLGTLLWRDRRSATGPDGAGRLEDVQLFLHVAHRGESQPPADPERVDAVFSGQHGDDQEQPGDQQRNPGVERDSLPGQDRRRAGVHLGCHH